MVGPEDADQAAGIEEQDPLGEDHRLQALRWQARALQQVPERKGLVLFTRGTRAVRNESRPRATRNAALRDDLHIHPVEMSGRVAGGLRGEKGSAGGACCRPGRLAKVVGLRGQ